MHTQLRYLLTLQLIRQVVGEQVDQVGGRVEPVDIGPMVLDGLIGERVRQLVYAELRLADALDLLEEEADVGPTERQLRPPLLLFLFLR